MARQTRDVRLETRTKRTKLATRHEPYWRSISPGLYLGYRKGAKGGKWSVRLLVGNKYVKQAIGTADDHRDADGVSVFDYSQAQARAREFAENQAKQDTDVPRTYTVADAIREYLDWYAAHRKALDRTRYNCEAHILPVLGKRQVSELTTRELRKWLESLAAQPARMRTSKGATQNVRTDSEPRARQATANRILTILKAALNQAWREGRVPSDDAWRRVKPFRAVDAPKVRFLTEAECTRLLNACSGDFRQLVTAALLTGCRYGELTVLMISDFDPDAGSVFIRESKSGKPRHVPLTAEGIQFFRRVCVGQTGRETLFLRDDGNPWGESHQKRRLHQACAVAGIEPAVSFHVLRHTYASSLARRGVPLQVIAAVLGHADTRITEKHYAHLMPSFVADTIRANLPSFGVEADNVTLLHAKNPASDSGYLTDTQKRG